MRTDADGDSGKAYAMEDFLAVLAALQFALVILIAQRRIPLAGTTEFVVVLSMLMLTAAHARIVAFLPDGSQIRSDADALQFLVIAVPIFVFMVIIEIWFIAYLFSYDPSVELKEFRDNATEILRTARALSIVKVLLVVCFIVAPPLWKLARKKFDGFRAR